MAINMRPIPLTILTFNPVWDASFANRYLGNNESAFNPVWDASMGYPIVYANKREMLSIPYGMHLEDCKRLTNGWKYILSIPYGMHP